MSNAKSCTLKLRREKNKIILAFELFAFFEGWLLLYIAETGIKAAIKL